MEAGAAAGAPCKRLAKEPKSRVRLQGLCGLHHSHCRGIGAKPQSPAGGVVRISTA